MKKLYLRDVLGGGRRSKGHCHGSRIQTSKETNQEVKTCMLSVNNNNNNNNNSNNINNINNNNINNHLNNNSNNYTITIIMSHVFT